jgi:hypothetical protein
VLDALVLKLLHLLLDRFDGSLLLFQPLLKALRRRRLDQPVLGRAQDLGLGLGNLAVDGGCLVVLLLQPRHLLPQLAALLERLGEFIRVDFARTL